MPYFLHQGHLRLGVAAPLAGDEGHHARNARRLRLGETLTVQDASGTRFQAQVVELRRKEVVVLPEAEQLPPPPSPLHLELLLAAPKEKALDWSLQKATELGVSRFHVFASRHSPKLPEHPTQRLERWSRIAWEACKQCERHTPPELHWSDDLKTALATAPPCRTWSLEPGSGAGPAQTDLLPERQARLIIGPEGGLAPDEQALLREAGIPTWTLGPRILRTETAVVAGATLLQFLAGDLASPTA